MIIPSLLAVIAWGRTNLPEAQREHLTAKVSTILFVRTFKPLPSGSSAIRDWLVASGITTIALESMGTDRISS